jgi:uncharacterized protein
MKLDPQKTAFLTLDLRAALLSAAVYAGTKHDLNIVDVPQHHGDAAVLTLLAKAAETNSAEAQFQLGVMMANGVGGPKDDVAARAMFEKAAAQGHPDALDWMGNFAEVGRGGPEDKDAAKGYYEKAAALGNEDAKAALERLKCPYVLKDKRGQILTHLCF